MMSFFGLPPEVNSGLMFSGAGSGPLLDAAAAWNGLAAELGSAADSFSAVTSELAGQAWQGPASQAMAAAAAPYASWLSAAAGHASGAATQAQAVASVYESALSAIVHPGLVDANRSGLVSLVMSNLFGQNAPAIAATESQYEQMWAQDVAAMVGYHGGASAAAAQLAAATELTIQDVPNLGYGNVGNGNIGFFNNGDYNFGVSNIGSLNVGIGNLSPHFDVDPDNVTTFGGFGAYNTSLENVGGWNTGFENVGYFNNGTLNIGLGNTGTGNSGLPLSLLGTLGIGNNGTFNEGLFNTGNHNIGIGLTGDNKMGVGPFYIGG